MSPLRARPAFHGTACWIEARLAQRPRRADRDAARPRRRPGTAAARSERAPSPRRSRSGFRRRRPASAPAALCRRSAPIGSARWRSTESGGTGRRGDIASSIRPSAWSRRSSSIAAEAAGERRARRRHDGADRAQADALQAGAGGRLDAAGPRAAGARSASSSSPAARMPSPRKRAAAQAAPGVEARPARTSKP